MKGGTLDIETFPGTYRAFPNNMYESRLMREDKPVEPASYSFKDWKTGRVTTRGVWEYETKEDFLWDLWDIFNDNDFIIGHFVKAFDARQSNSFFARQRLPKHSPVSYYCTKKICKDNFKLPSYSLKYVLVYFGIGEKVETGGEELWFGAEEGIPKFQKKMLFYNRNDTVQTDKLFRFFVENGYTDPPGSRYYSKEYGCPRCNGHDMESRGKKPSPEGWRKQYCCRTCGKRPMDEVILEPYRTPKRTKMATR